MAGFDSFEELQDGMTGYCQLDKLDRKMLEDRVTSNPHYSEIWDFTQEIVTSGNWNEEWEKNFPPVIISKDCRVKAEFHDPDPGFRYEITINPRMAFGTGHHETTALMMKEILDIHLEGKKVLDVGCGTAILGILCSLKGAADVAGLDHDKVAVESAATNIRLNRVRNLRLITGALSGISDRDFDLLLANIDLNYITGHIHDFAGLVKPGGVIICSGFFKSDMARIEAAVPGDLLSFSHSRVKKNWTVCVYIKNNVTGEP